MEGMELPERWRIVRLGEHIDRPDYGFTASAVDRAIGPKFLRITDIQEGGVNWQQVPYCECNAGTASSYLLRSGDIVIARIGATTGKSFLINDPPEAIFASYLIRVRPKITLSPDYLYFFCQSTYYWSQIEQNKGGRLKGGVTIPVLQNLILPLPSYHEQVCIAQALQTVQEAREARRREAALERERKASLMQYLFTHGTRGEARKETEIGEVPESWRVVRLEDAILQTQYGLSVRGNDKGRYPILRMNNLANGHVDGGDLQYVDLDFDTFARFRLERGDLLFNRTNSRDLVGKTGIFDLDGDFVFASYLIRVAVDREQLEPGYLNAYLNLDSTQRRLKRLASRGVSQSNINATKLSRFLFPLPSVEEQREIAAVLRACDDKIAALDREAAGLEELFRAMLEALMTGRLRVAGLVA